MKRKKAILIAVLVLLGLLLVEGAARVFYWLRGPEGAVQAQLQLSSFRTKPWARDFFEDQEKLHDATKRFVPFVEWEGREFDGSVLHVEPGGQRRTWNPKNFDAGEPEEVFVFGGSTVWGTGVPDESTIPSILSKTLNRDGARYRVINFGQEGYSSTQELIKLVLLLKEGRRPSLVIFYDGYNDAMASYIAQRAGAILGEGEIREKLEASSVPGLVFSAVKLAAKRYCATARLFRDAVRGVSPMFLRGARLDESMPHERIEALAQAVALDYRSTLDILDLLAARYGFRYAAFWQPCLFTEKRIVGDEEKLKSLDPSLGYEGLFSFFASVRRQLQAAPPRETFAFLTEALVDRQEQMYIDAVHLSEEGNEQIVRAMLDSPAIRAWRSRLSSRESR